MNLNGLVVHDPNPNKTWQSINALETKELQHWMMIGKIKTIEKMSMSKVSPSEQAIKYIIQDLTNRSGLGDKWQSIDKDTQEAIMKIWANIIQEEYNKQGKYNE